MAQLSRQNHYVPQWYQRAFICGSRGTLYRLDLDPPKRKLSNGRTVTGTSVHLRSPKRYFVEEDLYTTRFGQTLNDEVERFLFGRIDTTGALAVRAFAGNDKRAIHNHFQSFFEYLNAQKLRTPKGLDWIDIRYPDLTQVDLMVEMQSLRAMHCTMWLECVREIVSAKQSDVKFIVADHPVVAYNAACAPGSLMCEYPDDPPISLIGTQTIFALDADHCLILTNLEYAKDPDGVDRLALRQNARYSGSTLVRTNAMIRTRSLTRDEVISINSLLKSRSRRFLAAYQREWLFPEKSRSLAWEDIGRVLLPPSDGLWDFGGEIFVGYKDGSTSYRDPFGRAESGHESLKKKTQPAPAPDGPCGCGSGRRYRRCCLGVSEGDRPPWDVYSIRQRNQVFFTAVVDILGVNDGKTWDDIRRDLSDEQVKRIHEILGDLWPTDTDLADLVPRPDERSFRAIYMGLIDPRTIAEAVIGPLAYFDEIFVLNPFPNPRHMRPEYSPTQSPSRHKSQVLKNLSVLFALQPFIEAGIVHFVPDPTEFNPDFLRELMAMSEDRAANWSLKDEERQFGIDLATEDVRRNTLRFSDDQLRRLIRQSNPNIGSDAVDDVMELIEIKRRADPLALLQPLSDGGELQVLRSMNLELALFFAHLTGAAVYTDQQAFWRQLHAQTSAATGAPPLRWAPLAQCMSRHTFPIELNPLINLELRAAGKLCRMRRIFRRCWNAALTRRNDADDEAIANELAMYLENAARRSAPEWDLCSTTNGPSARSRLRFELSAPPAGFELNSVHRLLIKSGRDTYLAMVPLAFLLSSVDSPEANQ